MTFETELAALNEWHFFREFTYSKTTFRPTPSQEAELADSLIWLDNCLMVFQLKERHANQSDPDAERRWFNRKVLKQATKQVRDTLTYLNDSHAIEICNHRGHPWRLNLSTISKVYKLVVYRPHGSLPIDCIKVKCHRSTTGGFIHLIPAYDYLLLVRTLLTPAEVMAYLDFREGLINQYQDQTWLVTEAALLGQYLVNDPDTPPSQEFIANVERLEHRAEEWDLSGIISKFPERMTTGNAPPNYYPIIRELALLMRNELREVKTLFQLSVEKSKANLLVWPYRVAFPRTDCGFVFIPETTGTVTGRHTRLKNLTLAHKHELRLSKCVGVSIADDSAGWFTADWCYVESEWKPDPVLDQALRNNYPFREVRDTHLPRHTFNDPLP